MDYCPECGLDAIGDECEFCDGTGKAPEIDASYGYPDCNVCCGSGVGHADPTP